MPVLGEHRLDQLALVDVEAAYTALHRSGGVDGRPLAIRTVQRAHAVLHKALADAVRHGLLEANPATGAERPTVDVRARMPEQLQVWSAAQLRKLIAATEGDRWHPLWVVAAGTGMRRGELLGLRWDDVDLGSSTIVVRASLSRVQGAFRLKQTKTNRVRRLGIDDRVAGALAQRREQQEHHRRVAGAAWCEGWGLVFTRTDGDPLDGRRVSQEWRAATQAAGLPPIRFHDLRHTHASLLLAAGVPVKVVSQRLGHSSAMTTMDIYAHVLPAMDQDAVARFSDAVWATDRG